MLSPTHYFFNWFWFGIYFIFCQLENILICVPIQRAHFTQTDKFRFSVCLSPVEQWCFVTNQWSIKICFVNPSFDHCTQKNSTEIGVLLTNQPWKKLSRRLQNTTACDLVGLSLIINERKPQKRKFATLPTSTPAAAAIIICHQLNTQT